MTSTGFAILFSVMTILSADPKAAAVAKVNGVAITVADVDFAATQQGIAADDRPKTDSKLIEQLIDRQLIKAFLASKKIEPVAEELQFQIAKVEDTIRKRGEDPAKLLAKIGYTSDRMKIELGLPIAWQVYVRQTITPQQVKAYFEEHKQELDGTQLRGSQIFLKKTSAADESAVDELKQKLADVRRNIVSGQITFADAARKFSQAPSRETGGDIGLFSFRGKLPPAVSQAAFRLKVNEISEPIVSTLGVHLIKMTERHPGDLSLEDVRPVISDQLSQQLWSETAKKLRATAKIEWDRKE
jgi:parvulin-like peptidyl-prolyl isomerase